MATINVAIQFEESKLIGWRVKEDWEMVSKFAKFKSLLCKVVNLLIYRISVS